MQQPSPVSRRRATLLLIAIIATGASAAGTLGEPLVGVLAPVFEREIDVPGALTGQFVAVMFLSSAVFSLPAGQVVDRFSPAKITLLQLLCSAFAFGSFAFAESATWLFASSTVMGVAMALMGPLTNRIVVEYLPHRQRASAVGWRSLGPQMGVVFIGVLFAATGDFLLWRATILIVSAIILAFAAFSFVALTRRAPHDGAGRSPGGGVSRPDEIEGLQPEGTRRANPIVWWLMPYTFFANGVIASVSAYLIYFAYTEIGMSLAVASLAAAVASGVSIVARLLWVRLLTPRNGIALMIATNALTVGAGLLMVASVAIGPVGFWVAVVMIGAFGIGSAPIPQVLLVWHTNPAYIGRISAWNALVRSAGMAGQPLAMSIVVAAYGVAASWYVVAACALLAGLTMLVFRATATSR